jgi:molecular chaperone DnaK (HSP70)/HEAT repeat protein
MKHKLAIDFGATNSVIARWDDDKDAVEFLTLPGLNLHADGEHRCLIPSMLYVQDGRTADVTFGAAVLDNNLDLQKDNRLFRNFKRGMTTGANLPPRILDGVPWTDRDAGSAFLRGLLESLPFSREDIERLVLTVPVIAVERYTTWLNEVVAGFPMEAICIVDEPTAAALGYAVREPEAVVLVFDFGGGSLDLSLVQLPKSGEATGGLLQRLLKGDPQKHTAQVIAKAGLSIGGSDVDQWMLAEVLDRTQHSAQNLGADYASLLTSCERAKIDLSTVETTQVVFNPGGRSMILPFERRELEALLDMHGFYTSLRQAVDKVMSQAQRRGIFLEDIHRVLMVGGTSLMPSVQKHVQRYFKDTPVEVNKPFTAVAEGGVQVANGMGLEDYLAQGYGLRTLNTETSEHRYEEIIPMGSRYPTSKPVKVILEAAHTEQEAVEFVIGQVGVEALSMLEVDFEEGGTVFVAQAGRVEGTIVPLNPLGDKSSLVPLSPPGSLNEKRLEARFSIDTQRRLRLTVVDLKTKGELLQDAVVAKLSGGHEEVAPMNQMTGYEPTLYSRRSSARYRLSLRGVATMLNLLPPESVSLEALEAALHSEDFYVRYSAAEMLSKRGDRDARLILQKVLSSGSVPMRASVAHHLHRFSWYAAEPLLRDALDDPDSRVHVSAMYALCLMRSPNAYRLMAEVLPGEGEEVLMAVAWGLDNRHDAGAVPVLEIALRAQDPQIRVKSLESLGATASPEAVPVVRSAIDDPNLEVKYAAVLSLVELSRESCFAELADLIGRTRGEERRQILRGFFHATNYLHLDIAKSSAVTQVMEAMESALCDELPGVRVNAAYLLAWVQHPRSAELLLEGFRRESDPSVKRQMLHIATSMLSPAGETMLQEGLVSPTASLRESAQSILEIRSSEE